MMLGSKHANLIYECITYYIYAYNSISAASSVGIGTVLATFTMGKWSESSKSKA